MRDGPAGDFDYEAGAGTYSRVRRPDPHFAASIRAAFADARSLVHVGAGAGSYEPLDMDVTPVEPSAAMRALRPAHLQPAVDAVAEHLPFDDDTFDAALASVTIHQWKDLASGLREMRRVTRGPVVVLTFDPVALREFWLGDYAPEMMDHECGRMPDVDHVRGLLGGDVIVEPVPIPRDCTDGFAEAFFGRPETLLEEPVRRAQSAWGFVTRDVERQSVERLRTAIASGEWDERHGSLREAPWYEGSLRLIQSLPG